MNDDASLVAAIAQAQPGEEITLAPGTYILDSLSCAAMGTTAAPIVVRSQFPLAAMLVFASHDAFLVSGAQWHFEDLDVAGACVSDSGCDNAFHVVGAADGFVLRRSRVRDYNVHVMAEARVANGSWSRPAYGMVEYNEFSDSHVRMTPHTVAKVVLQAVDNWEVGGNLIHDFAKAGEGDTAYGVLLQGGGSFNWAERNLIMCSRQWQGSGTTVGVSLGGSGTPPEACAPLFQAAMPCPREQGLATLVNNIITNCSGPGFHAFHASPIIFSQNTLVGVAGIEARGNDTSVIVNASLVAGDLRSVESGSTISSGSTTNITQATFDGWYRAPLLGDLTLRETFPLLGAAYAQNLEDYCRRPRGPRTTPGALEHSLGDCDTVVPWHPDAGSYDAATEASDAAGMDDASTVDDAGGQDGAATLDGSVATDASMGPLDAAGADTDASASETKSPSAPSARCACTPVNRDTPGAGWVLLVAAALVARRRIRFGGNA